MAEKIKIKCVVEFEYDADPDHYPPEYRGNPTAMAEHDAAQFGDHEDALLEFLSSRPFVVSCVPGSAYGAAQG